MQLKETLMYKSVENEKYWEKKGIILKVIKVANKKATEM